MPKKKKASKKSAVNQAQSDKISELVREGYPQKQAIAISYSEKEKGGIKRLRESHGKK